MNEIVTICPLPTRDNPSQCAAVKILRNRFSTSAFSLLELLVVITVILVMMSLLLPAIAGFSSTAGRRGAVNIVMNSFEQARVAALESGQTVYIGFADNDTVFTTSGMSYSAFIVFRAATDEEKDSGKSYVVLKKWTRLPKKIAFKRVDQSLVPTGAATFPFSGLKSELGNAYQNWTEKLPYIAFNSTGAVDEPSDNTKLHLFLYEGYFDGPGNKEMPTRDANNLWEKISVSKYTGRAQLDITGT